MKTYNNRENISLTMAVWLAHDGYDGTRRDEFDIPEEADVVSATQLLKPTRQFVLSQRVPPDQMELDIADFISSRMGHAIHADIEQVWEYHYAKSMKRLGYPDHVIERVIINPSNQELKVNPGCIPIYLERRGVREIDGVYVSGKFDQVTNGQLSDNKTTSAWSWVFGDKDQLYRQQGSIYRWIFPEIITNPVMKIEHLFTDWSKSMAASNPKYPPSRVMHKDIDLMSISDTEKWIRSKLSELKKNVSLRQRDMVRCTDEELWRSPPVFKYYSKEETYKAGGRASKNFDSLSEANKHRAEKGIGIVATIPGKVKACSYCPAFPICEQAREYDHD